MNELKLRPLKCPQCGAPGVVRRGTRITDCERCGARLCLTEISASKYEVMGRLSAAAALSEARGWLNKRGGIGNFGRPELILVPYHEVSALRVGVFERKVPERKRRKSRDYSSGMGSVDSVESWVYTEKEDTKVMVADVQHLSPASPTPWDLSEFNAREVRRLAPLMPFDLVEAQRRATVYAEEETPSAAAARRFSGGSAKIVALSRRTLFFPFWSIPVETESGSFEIVLDAICAKVVAWRLPEAYPHTAMIWALLAVPGTFALGYGVKAAFLGGPVFFDPPTALLVGAIASAAALWRANRPDWALRSWPDLD